jgi:hypothetical protein
LTVSLLTGSCGLLAPCGLAIAFDKALQLQEGLAKDMDND